MSEFLRNIFLYDPAHPLLFTQFYFWAFFAVVYALFALIMEVGSRKSPGSVSKDKRSRLHLRNVYLMAVSWFFYYKTSGIFLLILAFVTLSDWLIVISSRARRASLRLEAVAPARYSPMSGKERQKL